MSYATKEQLESLMADIASKIHIPTVGIGGGYAPIGTIISYMGTTAPQDYLICDGSVYNIADYSQLANFIEAQFGSKDYFGGNGTTTFGVPDLRGEFLRGTGTNSHEIQGSGANVGEHQDATAHINGYITGRTGNISSFPPSTGENIEVTNADSYGILGTYTSFYTKSEALGSVSSSTLLKATYRSRPTNTSVLYCIKAVVAGEVYSTDERVVGTWIDGKPLYQKTVVDTMPTVTTDGTVVTKTIQVNASVKKYVNSYVFIDNTVGNHPFPLFWENSNKVLMYYRYSLYVNDDASNPNSIMLVSNTTSGNNKNVYATIQYTKTTD